MKGKIGPISIEKRFYRIVNNATSKSNPKKKRPAATFDNWQAATSVRLSAVRCEFGVNSLTESARDR